MIDVTLCYHISGHSGIRIAPLDVELGRLFAAADIFLALASNLDVR